MPQTDKANTNPHLPTIPSHREKLQQYLLDYYGSSTFNTCEHQALPLMDSPPMRLMIDPNATPTAHHSPIPVPLHWQDAVKAGLDRDVTLETVPIGAIAWSSAPNKTAHPEEQSTFQPLNIHATRETHHTQSPFHQARSVPQGKKKTVFDAWNGYHSVPLHPDNRHCTTFITPWGRYRYCTAPQGYIASGDGYTRRYDEITSSNPNKTKYMDDTLLWSDTIEESFLQAANWLDTCGRHGITLTPEKFRFAQDEVEFAGFEITNDTVRPCKRYITAIADFPTPLSLTDIRSWFGLVNQVLCIQHDRHDATLPGTTQAQQHIPLGRNSPTSIRTVEAHHHQRTESKSLTKPNPRAWPRTGRNMALVTGRSRSTAPAPPTTSSAANKVGRLPWWEADSHTLPNPDTPQLKGRH